MNSVIAPDLARLATRLVEVFECGEFTAADAAQVIGEGVLPRLVSAELVCTQPVLFGETLYSNKITPDDANQERAA